MPACVEDPLYESLEYSEEAPAAQTTLEAPITCKIRAAKPLIIIALLCFVAVAVFGFVSSTSSQQVRALSRSLSPFESLYVSFPEAKRAREHLRYFTSQEHIAGTPGDLLTAEYTAMKLEEYGWEVTLDKHDVTLTYPLESFVEIIERNGTAPVHLKLAESIVAQDKSSDTWGRNHTFNAYSKAGDVTGKLVYVNYASYEDFQLLKQQGVELEGTVALARYGDIFRGLKAMHAAEAGCAGILIYSDPADDGFVKGEVYPDGPWRPASGVQRGSAQYNSLCPGDPTDARAREECGFAMEEVLPSIPVQPIGYGDAQKLLEAIGGLKAPKSWNGGLDLEYHVGPGPANARLVVQNQWNVTTIWNVIARMPGSDARQGKDSKTVYLGNHRDAWVFGAVDPNSGTSTMLEVARSLKALKDQHRWTHRNDIVLCSWDGEEYGLIGSTAFGERFREKLNANAVAYINVDVGVSGSHLGVHATPSLSKLVRDVASGISDPNSGKALYSEEDPDSPWDGEVGRLGSGSDYTVFLDALGISSIDMSFSGSYGVYHSVYDSFHWMDTYGDPGFKYHETMAKLWGVVAMRLADGEVSYFNYSEYVHELRTYTGEVELTLQKVAPEKTLDVIRHAIDKLEEAVTAALAGYDELYLAERGFLLDSGLPGRQFFKHVVQAPGIDEGYAANVFPGLQDLIKYHDGDSWDKFDKHTQDIANCIVAVASVLSGQ